MIYLDNSATTRPCAEAVAAMTAALTENWGNPSALYGFGFDAAKLLREARHKEQQHGCKQTFLKPCREPAIKQAQDRGRGGEQHCSRRTAPGDRAEQTADHAARRRPRVFEIALNRGVYQSQRERRVDAVQSDAPKQQGKQQRHNRQDARVHRFSIDRLFRDSPFHAVIVRIREGETIANRAASSVPFSARFVFNRFSRAWMDDFRRRSAECSCPVRAGVV